MINPLPACFLITTFLLGIYAFPESLAGATTFRCINEQGKSVLTDSPAQLQNCQPLNLTLKPETPEQEIQKRVPNRLPPSPQPPPQEQSHSEHPEEKPKDEDSTSKSPIAIPLSKIGGSMVVQVLINGTQSAHLIVDTGATMTVLSYEIGVELGLLSGSGVDLSTVNTAGGSVQVSMTKVDQIQVGEAKAENIQVAIHDLPDAISGVSGLLGMSFLKNFTVTLDSDKGFLYLTPR